MMSGTRNRTGKSISSAKTGPFEIHQRAIRLGKALVHELEPDGSVDTLSRWMAHYIAEQLVILEDSSSDMGAKQRCFDTILKVWQHRAELPDGCRPFENFEPIFQVLNRLGDNEARFYLRWNDDD